MRAKIVRYAQFHEHLYQYSDEHKEWRFVACRLTGDMALCTGSRTPKPRGWRFDGSTTLTRDEERKAEVL